MTSITNLFAGRPAAPALLPAAASVALVLAMLGALGCKSKSAATPENFTAGLNKHLVEHPDCLLVSGEKFPYETTDPARTKQMDALVKATLLTKAEEFSIKASRYTVAHDGERFAPRFCYGYREVAGIVDSTPIAPKDGFKETTVTYRYTMKDVPVWAKTPEVEKAFPVMASAITGQGTAKAVLAQTPVGWQVPD